MAAIRNSGVSVFEGVVKCAINGMYCRDYALCPHYSVSPHFRGVRREGFHCTPLISFTERFDLMEASIALRCSGEWVFRRLLNLEAKIFAISEVSVQP